ncbi:chromate resistance protein [Desulfovibrio aminophilus]|nr:chromate resistance protein ChrB domain-containing protein [Desulfovibrio aminophilus]MCM0754030.1 chromate resistance protein [Desulfovibrio aminophilus]
MPDEPSWLLLIHNIPPKPAYLRAKVSRKLAVLGAIALKNAVYVLPDEPRHREDLDWLVREIEHGGGKAFTMSADLVSGLEDAQVRALFQAAREEDYAELVLRAKEALEAFRSMDEEQARAALADLQQRKQAVGAIDFFGAPSREGLEGLLASMDARLRERQERHTLAAGRVSESVESFRSKVWVTRAGVHVDRMASAWLVLRFIDAEARFRFVDVPAHEPEPGEVTFDMRRADFTHEDDRCTFETLIRRLGLRDAALDRLGEMVHDIDLKEDRYGHPETRGLAVSLSGVALRHPEDLDRIRVGCVVLDALYEGLRLHGGGI